MNNTPRVTVPVEPTEEMLEAGILAAWPGPEIVYADEHAGPEFMIAAAFKAMLSASGEVDRPVWFEGAPSQHHAKEWFIAETTFGDRVVLTALPEEYTYDFKTADETYIKADRIKRWMPFPDSAYLPPIPAPAPEGGAVTMAASALLDACIADFGDPKDFPDDDGWVASGDKGDSAVTFKHMRDLQSALATREEAPAEAGSLKRQVRSLEETQSAFDVMADHFNLDRAQPPDREDAQPVAWMRLLAGQVTDLTCIEREGYLPLYFHPAPDALRVAVEALIEAREDLFVKADKDEIPEQWASVQKIDQALAALQAEQED